MIELEIPGIPVPWSAPSIKRRAKWYSKHSNHKIFTQWQIKSLYRGKPLTGFVVVEYTFIEPPPASASKKTKQLMLDGTVPPARCDVTNLIKFMEDCLKNIVFLDDRYVAKNIGEKLYGTKGKILIKIWTLEEYRKLNNADHPRKT